jgi:membrane protease YdiL (CAAX protease family)
MPIRSLVFIAVTFTVSWSLVVAGWLAGGSPLVTFATLSAAMAGPAIGGLVCVALFEKGRRREALGLRFRPNLWWMWSWVFGVLLAAGSVAATIALGGSAYADIADSMSATAAAQGLQVDSDQVPGTATIIVASIVFGAAINSVVLTLTEELGWRGYLHGLWRDRGFWPMSLTIGAIWGVWHAPMILLLGHNYPDERALGAVLFVGFCMLLSPWMSHLRERGGSVIAPGIAHGTINACGGLTLLALASPAFPWSGLVGIGGFVALGIALLALIGLRWGGAKSA